MEGKLAPEVTGLKGLGFGVWNFIKVFKVELLFSLAFGAFGS